MDANQSFSQPALARDLSWHLGWKFETTYKYLKENPPKVGDILLVVSTQASVLTYEIAEIKSVNKKSINFGKQFGWAGPSFYFSGKNCHSPKGKTRMVPINKKVIDYFKSKGKTKIEIDTMFQPEQINTFLEAVNA